MSQLPEDWMEVKLGEILNVQTGKKNAQDSIDNGDYPFFTRSVDTQRIDTWSYDAESLFIAGEGNFAVKYYNGKFDLHQRTYMLTALKENAVDLKFLQNNIQPKVAKLVSTSVGSTVQSLRKPIIESLKIPLPPLEEQKKIADILSTVDKKIAFVEDNISQTEELKKGLMQKLLTQGIGHTEFKDSEVGRIPESWNLVQFDKVCDIRDGTHDSPKYIEEGIPFITSKHLTDNGIDFTETNYITKEDHIEFSKRSKVDNGDILFGMIGTIGKPTIVDTDFEFSIKNVALLKLSNNEFLSNIYILNLLKSSIINKQFLKFSNGGVQSFIALGIIRKLKIPVPPLEEQKQIAEILSTVDQKLEVLKEKKDFFKELKKGLMQKLLTGVMRV